jgi:hypothetical protein
LLLPGIGQNFLGRTSLTSLLSFFSKIPSSNGQHQFFCSERSSANRPRVDHLNWKLIRVSSINTLDTKSLLVIKIDVKPVFCSKHTAVKSLFSAEEDNKFFINF